MIPLNQRVMVFHAHIRTEGDPTRGTLVEWASPALALVATVPDPTLPHIVRFDYVVQPPVDRNGVPEYVPPRTVGELNKSIEDPGDTIAAVYSWPEKDDAPMFRQYAERVRESARRQMFEVVEAARKKAEAEAD